MARILAASLTTRNPRGFAAGFRRSAWLLVLPAWLDASGLSCVPVSASCSLDAPALAATVWLTSPCGLAALAARALLDSVVAAPAP